MQAISFKFNVSEEQLSDKNRAKEIAYARNLFQYFMSINNEIGSWEIASRVNRDHATMFSSRNRIEGFLELYADVRQDIMDIADYIKWLYQLEMEIKMEDVLPA